MSLHEGKSKKVISANIAELMHAFKTKGKVGNIKSKGTKKNIDIAAAISYRKARESK